MTDCEATGKADGKNPLHWYDYISYARTGS